MKKALFNSLLYFCDDANTNKKRKRERDFVSNKNILDRQKIQMW